MASIDSWHREEFNLNPFWQLRLLGERLVPLGRGALGSALHVHNPLLHLRSYHTDEAEICCMGLTTGCKQTADDSLSLLEYIIIC